MVRKYWIHYYLNGMFRSDSTEAESYDHAVKAFKVTHNPSCIWHINFSCDPTKG